MNHREKYGRAVELLESWMKEDTEAAAIEEASYDPVSRPAHYVKHPSGLECIQVTEHMGFCLGNAMKYIWRADLKGNAVEDLKKARWYIDREIERRTGVPQ